MTEELNKLELSILERLAVKYPFIKEHIPFLKVDSRENTGVGMYVNLIYNNPSNKNLNVGEQNSAISTNETIEIAGLKYGLGYEVDITEGKIKFIELVTYGEEWDGIVPNNFTFTR
jgi:hypothetical protein